MPPRKKAAKKKEVRTKRPYTKRALKKDEPQKIIKFNGLPLLQLEKVDLKTYLNARRGERLTGQWEAMKVSLQTMKKGQAFVVKKSWVKKVHAFVDELKLEISVQSFAIDGNPRVRRVVRLQ